MAFTNIRYIAIVVSAWAESHDEMSSYGKNGVENLSVVNIGGETSKGSDDGSYA